MIQVSLNSPVCNNISYGKTSVTKAASNVAKGMPKVSTPVNKKTVNLGALIAGLFTAKKAKTDVQEETPKSNYKQEYREERVYDKHGNLTNILKFSKADDVLSINVSYDTKTGNVKQKDYYRKNGMEKQMTEIYDNNGKKKTSYGYYTGNENTRWVEHYNNSAKNPVEVSWFDRNGNVTEQVQVDEKTGDVTTRFKFDDNNRLSEQIELSTLTGKPKRVTNFYPDGTKTVKEYDIATKTQTAFYSYDKTNKLVDFNINDNRDARALIYFDIKNKYNNEDNFDEPKKNMLSKKDSQNIGNFLAERFYTEYSE